MYSMFGEEERCHRQRMIKRRKILFREKVFDLEIGCSICFKNSFFKKRTQKLSQLSKSKSNVLLLVEFLSATDNVYSIQLYNS